LDLAVHRDSGDTVTNKVIATIPIASGSNAPELGRNRSDVPVINTGTEP